MPVQYLQDHNVLFTGEEMIHDYYSYTTEELLERSEIPLEYYRTAGEVFEVMAREMADEIERKNALGERTVFICPVGPIGQYPRFVSLVNERKISLKNTWFFNMDEYLTDEKEWIDTAHPLSFRGFMERNVYDGIDPGLVMPEDQRIFPDPHDPGKLTSLLESLGGADICFGGIGLNGHIAFNESEPGRSAADFLEKRTRVLAISPETRAANAIGDFGGALEDMPRYCVTVGMREIYASKKIRLGCFRTWHHAVVRRAAFGEAAADFPVTLLRDHPDIMIRFTEEKR